MPTRKQRWGLNVGAAMLAVVVMAAILVSHPRAISDGVPPAPRLGPARAVYNGDVGDPFVLTLTDPTRYIVFGTDDPPARVPTATSTDLIHWTPGPDAFPALPWWAAPDPRDDSTWAPAVLAAGAGRFVLRHLVPAGPQWDFPLLSCPEHRPGDPSLKVLRGGPASTAGPVV